MANDPLIPQPAFTDWRDITLRDLTVLTRDDVTIAHLCAAQGKRSAVSAALRSAFGVSLPEKPECITAASGETLVWAGPDQWLIVAERTGGRDLESELAPLVAGLAAVTDQSDARVIVKVRGAHARSLLAKGIPIDLHPIAFPARGAVVTHASHIGVILWQLDDEPTYELAVFRSFADSFASWLRSAAGEWGYVRRQQLV